MMPKYMNVDGEVVEDDPDNKIEEVRPDTMVVLGVVVGSRYGKLNELALLLRLMKCLNDRKLFSLIGMLEQVWFDSSRGSVDIIFDEDRVRESRVDITMAADFLGDIFFSVGGIMADMHCGKWSDQYVNPPDDDDTSNSGNIDEDG